MKKIKVKIKGTSPLLMDSPQSMLEEKQGIKSATKKKNPIDDIDKLAYKMKDGTLYIPAEAIKGSIIGASSYKKFDKYSAKPIISGCVRISPSQISLNQKEYDIDIRTAVNRQMGRIIVARPMINEWEVEFGLEYDDNLIGNHLLIKEILEDAGKRVGLLAFRPQKNGSFGMFEVIQWKEK